MAKSMSQGFTLLEVVISLTILGLIAGVLYGSIYLGVRAQETGEDRAASGRRQRVLAELLSRQLKSTVSYQARTEGEQFPYFFGNREEIHFITAAPQLEGGAGLGWVTYRVEREGLWMEEALVFSPDTVMAKRGEESVRTILVGNDTEVRFAYLAEDEDDWVVDWDSQKERRLPAAVKVFVHGGVREGGEWSFEIPIMTVAYGGETISVLAGRPQQEPPSSANVAPPPSRRSR